jgi:hypothetical protein
MIRRPSRLGRRGRLAALFAVASIAVVGAVALASGSDDPDAGVDHVAPAPDEGQVSTAPGARSGQLACPPDSDGPLCRPPATTAPPTTAPADPSTTAVPAPQGATGFPTPASTGVPAGWEPAAVHEGDLTVDEPGTVLEDLLVTGDVQVRAVDVTIRRTRIHGIVWNQYSDTEQFPGLLLEDVELGPDTGVLTDWGHGAVGTAGYTARRVEIHNVTDGFRVSGDDVVIEDSFVSLTAVAGECNHLDAVQGYGGGQRVVIRHNTLDARGECGNAAVFMADSSPHAVVEGNLLLGGAYSLRLNQAEVPATFVARGNRFADGSWDFGPMDVVDSGSLDLTCADNRIVTVDADFQVTGDVGEVPCP